MHGIRYLSIVTPKFIKIALALTWLVPLVLSTAAFVWFHVSLLTCNPKIHSLQLFLQSFQTRSTLLNWNLTISLSTPLLLSAASGWSWVLFGSHRAQSNRHHHFVRHFDHLTLHLSGLRTDLFGGFGSTKKTKKHAKYNNCKFSITKNFTTEMWK